MLQRGKNPSISLPALHDEGNQGKVSSSNSIAPHYLSEHLHPYFNPYLSFLPQSLDLSLQHLISTDTLYVLQRLEIEARRDELRYEANFER